MTASEIKLKYKTNSKGRFLLVLDGFMSIKL